MTAGAESRAFKIGRGTKKRDHISPKLFNAVLQMTFAKVSAKWKAMEAGIPVGERRLTDLRFAGDVLLIASTAGELEGMLEDLAGEAGQVGLQIHFGKTKVLCNRYAR